MQNFTLHGANPYKQYEQFNIEQPNHVIDFSANVNVLTYPKPMEVDYSYLVVDYPDDECMDLRKKISTIEGISMDQVLFTNGSNEAIYLISSYYNNKNVGILHPTYSEYDKALKAYGANVLVTTSLTDALERKLDALFLCSPNNPTGKFYTDQELIPFLEQAKSIGMDIIIDQAYIDFSNESNDLSRIVQFDHVYILRSITKIFPLAGIRIGYVIANESKIDLLKKRLPTWSVNAVAQALALKYLDDQEYIQMTKDFYTNERIRVMNELRNIGYELMDSSVNFYLIRTYDDVSLIKFLLEKGIVVRHTRNHITLDGKYIRVAVRTIEDNNLLIESLKQYKNM